VAHKVEFLAADLTLEAGDIRPLGRTFHVHVRRQIDRQIFARG
jgi:hypothetical protein